MWGCKEDHRGGGYKIILDINIIRNNLIFYVHFSTKTARKNKKNLMNSHLMKKDTVIGGVKYMIVERTIVLSGYANPKPKHLL